MLRVFLVTHNTREFARVKGYLYQAEFIRDGKKIFLQTTIIQDAVIRNFEIIGEATKRLSPELKAAYPDVPWQQVAGFRDVLIHDYLKVNLNRVWGVIIQNVPQLKATVEAISQELGE